MKAFIQSYRLHKEIENVNGEYRGFFSPTNNMIATKLDYLFPLFLKSIDRWGIANMAANPF